ncbi:hypothetical protein G3480_25955 [Thiorhodococcus mannitoliphagus]|uniref:DUF3617 family protein n=1 Tax=Thiorhodococcus mannitoliphagus TaxID=329406 RepID=A0A6P1E3R5_9GAMM|nr:hypothetical protein [Thiorhodococcus mannitoliphagus]NEX23676.1 hypothetical protein [Thiorhodococcus mannitoliphagus]
MSLSKPNVFATVIFFGTLSFPVLAADLSGCDQEELDILMQQVKRGYWTIDEVVSHCQPGYVGRRNRSSCKSFAGSWHSDEYNETVNLEQTGEELHGTCDTRGFTHSMKGIVTGNTATYNTTRTNKHDGCTTVMYGNAELIDNCSKLKRVVNKTDGNCDLSTSFGNVVIYELDRR